MRTFRVLVRHEGLAAPSLHLVQAWTEAMAGAIADELLGETHDGVGVEVWDGEQRIFARKTARA